MSQSAFRSNQSYRTKRKTGQLSVENFDSIYSKIRIIENMLLCALFLMHSVDSPILRKHLCIVESIHKLPEASSRERKISFARPFTISVK